MADENETEGGSGRRRTSVSNDSPSTEDFHRERSGKIKRSIDVLRELIAIDWYDQSVFPFTRWEREELKQHIKWCALELNALLLAFEEADRTEVED